MFKNFIILENWQQIPLFSIIRGWKKRGERGVDIILLTRPSLAKNFSTEYIL